jgi:hypothetical protein
MYLSLDTVGITNGCIDTLISAPSYPDYAFNNTYGLQMIPKDVYEAAVAADVGPGGCQDQILECQKLGNEWDPLELGNNATVNAICANATGFCFSEVQGVYALSNVSTRL